jgi:hypothetical protein
MTTVPGWPPIPAWEQSDLETLSSEGELSGVNPEAIAVIDSAESSGEGGGINSAGYGGFFGLGANKTYPAGESTSAMLSDPGEASFEDQAVIAASAFDSYLKEAGGNPVTAEEIYQSGRASGPTEGSTLMAQYLGGSPGAAGGGAISAGATLTSINPNPLDLFGIPQTITGDAAAAVWSEVGPFLVKAILVIAGLTVMVIGISRIAKVKPSFTGPQSVLADPDMLAAAAA